ncbi:hypothetical protein ELE36_00055 (plasmid) [Pseudolysobacter antarcticus]|uniref:Uncharacterized protein n=1 Tax=Pseudolysobacter antarcticus TaxID=2511995 RepID=A0A411HEM0_9GAMM|nr:hypothetical protein [Pseudolysobacter antarcticus]QBB68894.1 hypothetical protein ELE36_00055 [Pseudolysobacter antarcticus]
MITLNGRTKLTTAAEKRLVELGGGNPQRTLTSDELGNAMAKGRAVTQARTRALETLYLAYRREDPTLPALEHLRESE